MGDINDSSAAIEPLITDIPKESPRPTWPTWIEILTCSGYPTQIFLGQLLVLAGVHPVAAGGDLSPTFVFVLSFADTALLLSLIIFFIVRRGERPSAVFFGTRATGTEVVFGIGTLPGVLALVLALTVGIQRFLPTLHNVPDNPLEGMIGGGANMWVFLMLVIVAGGVREELQRAFLLHRFRDDLGVPWLGLIITSMAFGMGHTLQGLDAAIITGALGATWGVMYLTRGSALAPMVSHALFNSGELLRAFLR